MPSKTFDAGEHRVTVRTRLLPIDHIKNSFSRWWVGDVFISVVIDKKLYKDIGYIRRSNGFNPYFYYLEFDYDDCPINPYSTYTKCSKNFYSLDELFEQACNYVYNQLKEDN